MEAEGINETMQIVRVTENGAEKFFSVSGNTLRLSKNIVTDLAKVMALIYRKARRGSQMHGEKDISMLMKSGTVLHSIRIPSSAADGFEAFAGQNNISYSVIDSSGGKLTIVYPDSEDSRIKNYSNSHSDYHLEYTSLLSMAQRTNAREINVMDDYYIDISEGDIASVDRIRQAVWIRAGDRSSDTYALIPAKDLRRAQHGSKKEYSVRLRRNAGYICSQGGLVYSNEVPGSHVAQALITYQDKEKCALENRVKDLDIDIGKKSMLLGNPLANKREINKLYREKQYGTNNRIVSFFNGTDKKNVVLGKNKSADISKDIAGTTKKAVSQTVQIIKRR